MARTIEAFVASLDAVLTDAESRNPGRVATTRRRMRTIAHQCGWKARSKQRSEDLASMLEESGIYAFPEITDADVDFDTFVSFSRNENPD